MVVYNTYMHLCVCVCVCVCVQRTRKERARKAAEKKAAADKQRLQQQQQQQQGHHHQMAGGVSGGLTGMASMGGRGGAVRVADKAQVWGGWLCVYIWSHKRSIYTDCAHI